MLVLGRTPFFDLEMPVQGGGGSDLASFDGYSGCAEALRLRGVLYGGGEGPAVCESMEYSVSGAIIRESHGVRSVRHCKFRIPGCKISRWPLGVLGVYKV